MTAAARFAETAETTVGALAVGDFLVEIPAQEGQPARRVASGITAIEPDRRTWTVQTRRRGPRWPVEARALRFIGAEPACYPADWRCLARRREA